MEYDPLKRDVFGLVDVLAADVYNMDLLQKLNNIMPVPQCDKAAMFDDVDSGAMEEDSDVNFSVINVDSEDCYLATIRSDAFEEFSRNGIEQDLDEVDVFQSRLRERTRPSEPENPVAAEYMVQKQRKAKRKKINLLNVCVFCKNNNEQPRVYSSHMLKDSEGRTTCPILRKYTCPICGVRGGDKAHTIRYCPRNLDRDLNPGLGALMNSPHLSVGKRNPRCSQ